MLVDGVASPRLWGRSSEPPCSDPHPRGLLVQCLVPAERRGARQQPLAAPCGPRDDFPVVLSRGLLAKVLFSARTKPVK